MKTKKNTDDQYIRDANFGHQSDHHNPLYSPNINSETNPSLVDHKNSKCNSKSGSPSRHDSHKFPPPRSPNSANISGQNSGSSPNELSPEHNPGLVYYKDAHFGISSPDPNLQQLKPLPIKFRLPHRFSFPGRTSHDDVKSLLNETYRPKSSLFSSK
jgi:hypothetical protein